MIKPECLSTCEEKGELIINCPHCGAAGNKSVFCNDTSLYIYNIRVKEIHNRFFAVCTQCKKTFEVAEK